MTDPTASSLQLSVGASLPYREVIVSVLRCSTGSSMPVVVVGAAGLESLGS